MSKKKAELTQTEMPTSVGATKHLQATVVVDDSPLPSPTELEAYRSIDPAIVHHLLQAAEREQQHRHSMDNAKVQILQEESKREIRINTLGMISAFFVVMAFVALTAFALWLDKGWFAGIFGLGALSSLVSIFLRPSSEKQSQKK